MNTLLRDPRTNPKAGDELSVGDHLLYMVDFVKGSMVSFTRLERGRKRPGIMPVAAWRSMMETAVVAKVSQV